MKENINKQGRNKKQKQSTNNPTQTATDNTNSDNNTANTESSTSSNTAATDANNTDSDKMATINSYNMDTDKTKPDNTTATSTPTTTTQQEANQATNNNIKEKKIDMNRSLYKMEGAGHIHIHTKNYRDLHQPEITLASFGYPSTEAEHAKYLVYEDLYDKGYYLSGASKFGGDFLVYPGM